MKKLLITLVVAFMLMSLSACGDNDSSSTSHDPVADAGADQNISVNSLVTLDGSASSDRDGDIITYSWFIISAPVSSLAVLSDPSVVRPTFTADLAGSYEIGLVVNDGTVDSSEDIVIVTAATGNSAPVADAGNDQNVATGDVVTLDGSGSSDSDGDSLTYSWTLTSSPGSPALIDPMTATPYFMAASDGTYVVSLIVNDGTVDSIEDTVTVVSSTTNSAPVADAGDDQNVVVGNSLSLDGNGSSDADNDPLNYTWSITSAPVGSSATLSDNTAENPTFTPDIYGVYVFSLIVDDGIENSNVDTVTISTTPPSGYVAVNFSIDDSANPTYDDTSGLAWKGSFSHNPATRILTQDGSWGGPYPMLYDDGPWTAGGHEPEGSTAGDHIWGVTVWGLTATETQLEYGAISGSINGSDGAWIWIGNNGSVIIPQGATAAITAPGLVL